MAISAFEQKEELAEDEWEEYREELRERYRFYVLNPSYTKGVNYSLWIQEGGDEYPVINSNSGGFTTFNSRSKDIGDGLKPTPEFLSVVGFGAHEAMCFMPDIYFRGDHFERLYNGVYDDKPREYEVWAAHVIVHWITLGDQLFPELEPLARWADKHTEFGIPILAKGDEL